MTDRTGIEWCDSTNQNPTGRVLGAYKVAASRTGLSLDQWMAHRRAGKKWCFGCKSWHPAETFTADKSRRGGLTSRCRPCMSEASTASRYGLTIAGLRALRAANGGRCEICGREATVVVDHDHASTKVRGLLCGACNSAIGMLRENPALFVSALAYLEKHRG